MAEEFRVQIGVELNAGSLSSVQSQLQSFTNTTHRVRIDLDTSRVQSQINNIRNQLQSLGRIRINLNGGGSGSGGTGRMTSEFRELMNIINQLNSKKIQLNGLNSSSVGTKQISTLRTQIQELETQYNHLISTMGRSLSGDQWNQITNAFTNAGKQIDNVQAKMSDTSAVQQQTSAYKELLSISKEMSSLELKIGTLKGQGGNANQITELEHQLQTLQTTYQQIVSTMQQPLSSEQWSSIYTQIAQTQDKLAQLDAKILDTKTKIASGINTKLDNGTMLNDLSKINTEMGKITQVSTQVQTAYSNLQTSYQGLITAQTNYNSVINNASSTDKQKLQATETLINANTNYQNSLKTTSNLIQESLRYQKESIDLSQLQAEKDAFSAQIDSWLSKNSAAAKQFGAELAQIKAQIQGADSATLSNLQTQFKKVTYEAQAAGVATRSWGDTFKASFSRLSTYFSGMMVIMKSIQALKDMAKNVLDVDTAMTELYRVTDLTQSQYTELYKNMAQSAKTYGAELDTLINSTASWVRLGFNPDDANRLAEITTMYQHVTDLDESTAVNNLVTAYKGYEKQLLELHNGDSTAAVEQIADIYDKLGNEFAESAADVGEGLSKSASVLAQGGASIEEAAGMFTGMQEVLQDASVSGGALKILTLRIRGMKGELQELGEDVDENVDSISKVQTQILNLTHGKVNIFDENGDFRNIYNIMEDISKVYYELSDPERASLLEIIAGKNRANAVQALIDNWSNVEKATEAAYNAAGTAQAEQDIWMDSLQGHLTQLKVAWQALSVDFLKSDFLKGLVDIATKAIDILDALVKKFGMLGTIGLGLGIAGVVKNFGTLTTLFKGLTTGANTVALSFQALGSSASAIAGGIGIAVSVIALVVQAYKNYQAELARARQETIDTNNEIFNSMDSFEHVYAKYSGRSSLTSAEEAELKSAIDGTVSALGNKASALGIAQQAQEGYLGALEDTAKAEIQEAERLSKESLKAAQDQLLSDTWSDWSGSKITIDLSGRTGIEEFVKAKEILEQTMSEFIDEGTYGQELEPINFDKDRKNIDNILEYYYRLTDAKNQLVDADLMDNDVYKDAKKILDSLTPSVEQYLEQQYNAAKYAYELANGIPKTTEEYQKMRETLLGGIADIPSYRDAFANLMDNEWGDIFDVGGLTATAEEMKSKMKEIFDAAEENAIKEAGDNEQGKRLAQNVSENMSKWFEGLDDGDKEIAYNIAVNPPDDTTFWTIARWQDEIAKAKETADETKGSFESFSALLNDTGDGNFSDNIEGYLSTIDKLQGALDKIDTGELSEKDRLSLALEFPELTPYINDTDALSDAIQGLIDTSNEDINDLIAQTIEEMGGEATEAGQALLALQEAINGLTNSDIGWNFDIDEEVQKFDNLYSAMKESYSATGLSTKGLNNVKNMFKDLEGYDPSKLFERTANGIHLNGKELRNLQAEYEKQKKQDIDTHLNDLIDQYTQLSDEISSCTDANERASKISQLNDLRDEISNVADLAAQYEGLTSSYNKWIHAKSAGEEGDMYDQMRSGFGDAQKLYEEGLVGTNAFRTYVDLLSNQDLQTASVDEVVAAYEKLGETIQGTSYKATDFLADGSEGCENFLNAVQELNTDWAKMNEDGSWDINFGVGNDQEIADALGIDVEYVQSILRKLSDYGFDINLDSAYTSIDQLGEHAVEANEKLKELGQTDIDFDFNTNSIDEIDTQITEAQTLLDKFRNTDGTVNTSLEGATEAETVLVALISKKQQLSTPSILTVDTSGASENLQNAINLLSDLQSNYNDLQIETAIGADTTDAQTNIQSIATELNSIEDKDIRAALNLDDADFQTALSTITSTEVDVKAGVNLDEGALSTIQSTISGIDASVVAKFTADTSGVDAETAKTDGGTRTVKYTTDTTATDAENAKTDGGTRTTKYLANTVDIDRVNAITNGGSRTVRYSANTSGLPNSFSTITRYVNYVKTGATSASGTAHSNGTAFAKGDWGTKKSGVALGGEVGQELVVRDGKFFTIGDDGAEFFNFKKDDIIFNAGQTEQIFKYGKIKNGKKRGEVFAQGTAFIEGTAFSHGSGKIGGNRKNNGNNNNGGNNKGNNNKSGNHKSNNKKSKSSKEKDFEETFDWIEVKIDRIERAISSLDKKANATYKSWSSRNKNLYKEINKITSEIDIQQAGYDRYLHQANSVGLSSKWAKKVRNGTIDINTIKDEKLADKIKDYQKWYEKALDCKKAMEELEETQKELYVTAFDNVTEQYDSILTVVQHEQKMLEEYISQSEEGGYLTSIKYYEALKKNERVQIKKLENEKAKLTEKMNDALAHGIDKNSQDWYDMCIEIDKVNQAIEEGNTALIKYNKNIREIKWQIFDLMEERISNVTTEAEFLIDLLSSSKLYTDNGQLTNEGSSTMGLHATNYNVYMSQADDYAKEMKEINKELAKDPANLDLEKRRTELLKLQQEMILAAEDEKEAIVDMVKDGIELELDSLKDLISTYKDALDAQKNLYDYQKKMKDSASEVSSIQKQLQAYSGDTSEETKTTIQKLKVSLENAKDNLEEAQYEKYISDQKELLDKLYLDYETTLNKRLDNIEALIIDMLDMVNHNSGNIANTIYDSSSKVGYTLTTEMKGIWGQAYAEFQNDANVRASQVTNILNTLVANGSISKANANKILSALADGSIQSVEQAMTLVQQLVTNGNISQANANKILASMNVQDSKAALNALNLVTKLTENGAITTNEANKIVAALVTNEQQATVDASNVIARLLANSQLSTQDATNIITALSGSDSKNIKNALDIINKLTTNGTITTTESAKIITALATGDAGAVANATNIINKLASEGALSRADAKTLNTALQASVNANTSKDVVAMYGKDFSSKATTINDTLNGIKAQVQAIVNKMNAKAEEKIKKPETKSVASTTKKPTTKAPAKKTTTKKPTTKKPTTKKKTTTKKKATTKKKKSHTTKEKYGVALAIWNGNYGWGTGSTRKKRLEAKGFNYNEVQGIVNKMGKEGLVYSGAWVGHYHGIRSLAPYHYNKFKLGGKDIPRNQMALTQEGKRQEFIVRPSDGAILTPIAKGDSVLTSSASDNIWNMANNPEEFIRDVLGLDNGLKTSNGSNANANQFNGDVNVNISLPNVQNYEQFKYQMQHDKSFERLVRSMTVDKMFGGSSLKKYRM